MTLTKHLPAAGLAAGFCLFAMAARHYPGFGWGHTFVSSLFAARALNGEANPARYIAIPAMLVLCAALGLMFRMIATTVPSRGLRKAIEIAGIGSAVYAFLAVTPMHDLMVSISLLFASIALFATLCVVHIERQRLLFASGIVCVTILTLSAAVYYSKVLYDWLPILQKTSLIACLAWLLSVHYGRLGSTTTAVP